MAIWDLETLGEKCVINLCDGKDLGFVCDVRFSSEDGRICAFVVPKCCGIFSVGKCDSLIIPWEKVECIGEDTILVRINENECKRCSDGREKKKKHFF